jgi:CTP:molybdopterin cytidylyltransferase MocA
VKVVAAVLAAGGSTRFGRPKQLALVRGVPLVRRVVLATAAPDVDERAVVVGANADAVRLTLDASVTTLRNARWKEGIASSVRVAVAWAQERRADALVLLLGDQPLVDAAHVARLVGAWRKGAVAAASFYEHAPGVPAIFDAKLFAELDALRGDRGAASLLRSRVDVARIPCPEAGIDVDTPHDLERLELGRLT